MSKENEWYSVYGDLANCGVKVLYGNGDIVRGTLDAHGYLHPQANLLNTPVLEKDNGEWRTYPSSVEIRKVVRCHECDNKLKGQPQFVDIPVPSEPGFYRDKDNSLWVLTRSGHYQIYGGAPMYLDGRLESRYSPYRKVRIED